MKPSLRTFMIGLAIMLATYSLPIKANAEITTATPFEIAMKMNKLGIVNGRGVLPDGSIDFNLSGNLTRAELVTTIVRSFGAEQEAQNAKGVPSFADVASDAWYSGYVAEAKELIEQTGNSIGRDSSTFDPIGNVSQVEALIFVMKFLGIKVEATGSNWYEAWINKAVELRMLTKEDVTAILSAPNEPATRGVAFVILDFGFSANLLEGGKNMYKTFETMSTELSVDPIPAETNKQTIRVSGTSKNAVTISIGDQEASIAPDGNWSLDIKLVFGGVTEYTVTAKDSTGNTTSKKFSVKSTAITDDVTHPSEQEQLPDDGIDGSLDLP